MAEKQKRAKLRDEVKEIREASKQSGSLIHELELDDYNLTFTMGEDVSVQLLIPESWPRGVYQVLDHHGMREIGRGKLKHIVDGLIAAYAKETGKEAIPHFPKEEGDDDAGPAPVAKQASAISADDEQGDFVPRGEPTSLVKAGPVLEAVRKVQAVFGDNSAGVMVVGSGDHTVRFRIDTSFIDFETAKIWGVHHNVPVILEMKLLAPHFLSSSRRPEVDIFQCGTTDLNANLTSEKYTFTLGWQLQQRMREFMNWPIKTDPGEFFVNLLLFMTDKVKNATKYCMICDKELDFIGLKPAVCNSPLCEYSHMQYGLGEDVSQYIHHNPEVVDMLISLSGAAACGDVKRFNPFPAGVEARITVGKTTETVGFTKGHEQTRDNGRVQEVIQKIPPVSELLKKQNTADLKEFLDAIDPLCFPLLRWIITSNRTHLELVPKDMQMSAMNTPYQFVLRSSTPEKEKAFTAERASKGSFFAFHGSAFSNWHCILRVGLKNYSGTDMMTCGAAYGNGIYMAPNSGTSFGYAGGGIQGWKNSAICPSAATCLALCEVVNAGYTAAPHYVVSNESHVNTRFFFLYSGSGGISVDASSLSVPDLAAVSRATDLPAAPAPKAKPKKR